MASVTPFEVGTPSDASAPLTGKSTPILIVPPDPAAGAAALDAGALDAAVELVELVEDEHAETSATSAPAKHARVTTDNRIRTTPGRRVGQRYARVTAPPLSHLANAMRPDRTGRRRGSER